MTKRLSAVIGTLRAPFLLLTPACVLPGIASAAHAPGPFVAAHAWLSVAGGLLAHVSVNTFNEYLDFRSGLDGRTKRTAFSGGSGSLPANPDAVAGTLAVAVASLLATAAVGMYFLALRGAALLPLGLLGLFLVVAYTNGLTRSPWACLIAPGLGFGAMTLGTHVAVAGSYSAPAAAASLVPFFLANNLLLLNQFPDVEADASVGRRHLPIAAGRPFAARVYALFATLAYVTMVVAVAIRLLPVGSLLGLCTLPLAAVAASGAVRHADAPQLLGPAMRMNVLVALLTPVLMAAGMLLG